MKKINHSYVKDFLQAPMILVFIFICLFLLPRSINLNSIAFRAAIVTALGIDLNENSEVLLNAEINISGTTDSLSENSKILTSTGQTLGEAFTNLTIQFGRPAKLAHTRYILIGKKLAESNVFELLDTLVRTNKIRNSVQLIYCPDDIVKIFDLDLALKGSTGLKLSDIITYQQKYSTTSETSNIDNFYKGYFSQSGISKINCISLTDTIEEGINPSPDSSGGTKSEQQGSEGSGGGQSAEGGTGQVNSSIEKQYISNKAEVAVFKNGTLSEVFSSELSEGISWTDQTYLPKKLLVEIDSNDELKGVTINFDILKKNVIRECFFLKGVPYIAFKIYLTIDANEIISKNEQTIEIAQNLNDNTIKSSVARTLRKKIARCALHAKMQNLDVYDINDIFFAKKYKEYTEFLKDHTKEEFLESTIISADAYIKIV